MMEIGYNTSNNNFYIISITGADSGGTIYEKTIIGVYDDNNGHIYYYRGTMFSTFTGSGLLLSTSVENGNVAITGFSINNIWNTETYEMNHSNQWVLTPISLSLGTISNNNTITIPLSNISDADDLKLIEALTGQGILKRTSNGWTLTSLGSELSSSNITSALGYTPYDSSNPMGYTSNTGTITGITMNGLSKGTSGVVDLGTVITDVSDKVSGPATATATHVATFSDTTGKVIQDSGYTIGTSVPSNAVFTDTTTSVSYSTTPASVNVSTTGATGSVVLGEAATKQVDSTLTSSSTNLPTSAAVVTYV